MAKNKKYSREFKESVLRRLEEPTNESIASICEELGISRSTIFGGNGGVKCILLLSSARQNLRNNKDSLSN